MHWQDQLPSALYYQGKSSVNPYIKLKARYQLSKNWSLTGTIYREFLDKNIKNSPLVSDQTIDLVFLGVVYAF